MQLLQVYTYGDSTNKIFSLCAANGIVSVYVQKHNFLGLKYFFNMQIYAGMKSGEIKASKLDLTVFYTCKVCATLVTQHAQCHVIACL